MEAALAVWACREGEHRAGSHGPACRSRLKHLEKQITEDLKPGQVLKAVKSGS